MPAVEHVERDRLDVDQVAHRDLARSGLAGRDADAAIAHHHRGHAVPRRGRERAVPADLRVVVRVRIDEARRHDEPARVDGALAPARRPVRSPIPAADNADIGGPRRRAGAVDDGAVLDQQVEHDPPIIAISERL